jgi:hypothetical protein
MNRAFLIFAAFAGYSIFETLLLLSVAAINYGPYSLLYVQIVSFAQLLLIPGLGVLISCIVYGSQRWLRRTLTTFGVICLFTAAFSIPTLIAEFADRTLDLDSRLSNALVWLVVIMWFSIMVLGPIFAFRITRARSVRLEAEHWLAVRRSGMSMATRKWCSRATRWAPAIPTLLVLPLFLFMPESMSIFEKLRHSRAYRVGGHQVTIPWTFKVMTGEEPDRSNNSRINGYSIQGIGHGVSPYSRSSPVAMGWAIAFDSKRYSSYVPSPWRDQTMTGGRQFDIGDDSLQCVKFVTANNSDLSASQRSWVRVECTSKSGFYADMYGDRRFESAFYDMLASVKPAR